MTSALAEGFFADDSIVRRVHREAAIYAAGPRALLLQFAHPKVAAGLADHSDLARRPVDRLLRTFASMDAMLFGDRAAALRASRRTAAMHARVEGELREAVGRFPAGERYAATDPALLLWVLATLIDSSLYAYEAFVAPLDDGERERYYAEIRVASPLLGLTPEAMPPTWLAMRAYIDDVVGGDTLAVGAAGRALAETILDARHMGAPLAFVVRSLAASTLPARVRDAFGFRFHARETLSGRALGLALRAFVALAPASVRAMRPWALVERRGRRAAGGAPSCPFARIKGALGA